jgi:integrating conjugative element relaxase (TIGR03760 family)
LVERIRSTLGYSPENYKRDVLPLIQNFAEFVQLLPASQSHHHAHPGGLLEHLLEVAAFALTKRNGYKLPLGTSVEDQLKQASLWSYAVLIASLLHDIGKPISDVHVTLYGDNPNQALGAWSGMAGSMRSLHQKTAATHYTVDFPDKSDYAAHGKLSSSLLHLLVPQSGMAWLGTEAGVFKALVQYLDGNAKPDDPIAEIIKFADMTSVSENLKTGSRVRFANVRLVPLIERLMDGLRQVVVGGHLPVNRPGAAIYIDPDGEHMWVVAGHAADKVRELLIAGKRGDGIPADNTRLFDTWQEFGACISPPTEFGKGAVWWAMLEQQDPEWRMVLTMLKFRVKDVYGANPVPQAFKGSIVPTAPGTERPKSLVQLRNEQDAVQPSVDHLDGPQEGQAAPQGDGLDQPFASTDVGTDSASAAPSDTTSSWDTDGTPDWMRDVLDQPLDSTPESKPLDQPSNGFSNSSQSSESAIEIAAVEPASVEPEMLYLDEMDSARTLPVVTGRALPPVQVAPNAPTAPATSAPRAPWRKPGATVRVNADSFVAWLQTGLGNGSIIYNESEAFIHFVDGGMLILSPKAMKVYLDSNPYVGETNDKKGPLQALQREIEKAGYIAWNKESQSFFHKYKVKHKEGTKPKVVKPMSCYMIPNPQAYIRPVPAPNEHIERVVTEDAAPQEISS